MAFKIVRNDITKVAADIIVNSANPEPVCGGSTEALIYDAAGYDELLEEREKIGYLDIGQVAETPAFNLQAKNIVHVSCPWWDDGNEASIEKLHQCYRAVLKKAVALDAHSIAIPLLSSGVYRFPKDVALNIAAEECKNFGEGDLEITLVVYDPQSFEMAKELFHDVEDLLTARPKLGIARGRVCIAQEAPKQVAQSPSKLLVEGDDVFCRKAEAPKRAPVAEQANRSDVYAIPKYLSGYAVPKKEKAKTKAHENEQDSLHNEIDAAIMGIGEPVVDDSTFQEKLEEYIERSAMLPADIYRAANIDRRLFSKIRTKDSHRPKKKTVLALSVGLRLTFDETEDFLKRAGHTFSPDSKSDIIFKCCLKHDGFYKVKYAVWEPIQRLNDILREYHEATLGATLSDDK